MAKKRRPPLSGTARAALAQPLLDKALGLPPSRPSPGQDRELDIAPLLVALRSGALDGHIEALAREVNDRLAAIEFVEELIAASKLHVGDQVLLGHNLRPKYLHGRAATVIAQDRDKWIVRLVEPVEGRYADGDFRVYATQLEIGPET
jgi:hypothetical protein